MATKVSYIPDTPLLHESMAYDGPPYPMFRFLPYRDRYESRLYRLDTTPASVIGNQRGYFRALEYPRHPVTRIKERHNGKWLLWMSNTEMEIHSHMAHVANAHGTTVVCGLGLGMVAYAFAQKPEVDRVFVIERNRFLLHHFYRMLRFIPPEWEQKVTVLQGDVLVPNQFSLPPVDFMYCDTWETLGSAKGPEHVRASYEHLLVGQRPKAVGSWGQEMDYLYFCSQDKLDYKDRASFDKFCEWMGAPLLLGLPTWEEYLDTVSAVGLAIAAQSLGHGDGFREDDDA